MYANSSRVVSKQNGAHENLAGVVLKHLNSEYHAPINQRCRLEAAAVIKAAKQHQGGIILDSGCGTGESTQGLAALYPDCFVIGVDKSLVRLRKAMAQNRSKAQFIRANVVDFWRLALEADLQLSRHFIYYPNPWPKKKHLGRRWHAHPVFPTILSLGGLLTIRSNWKVYLEEFTLAMEIARGYSKQNQVAEFADKRCREKGVSAAGIQCVGCKEPISAFERKYLASGHELFECAFEL